MGKTNDFLISRMFRGSLMVMIVTMITTTVGMLVDGIVIGRCLGVDAMAAYGVVSPAFIVAAAIAGVFSSGVQTLCAKEIGAGRIDKANNIFSLTCIIGGGVGLALNLVMLLFAKPIAVVLGASGSASGLLGEASGYLIGLSFGMLPMILSLCWQPIMQLDADKPMVMISVVLMTASNVAGDLLNAFVFKGGMLGMAIATTISYFIGMLSMVPHFMKKEAVFKFSPKGVDYSETKNLLSTGLPTAVNRVCNTLRTLVLNKMLIAIAGSSAVAALSVQTNASNFFGSAAMGAGMATLLISGIVVGEEDKTSSVNLVKTALLQGGIVTIVVTVLLYVFAPAVVALYISGDPQTTDLAIRATRFFALSMPFYLVTQVFMNFFQGSKNLKLANIANIFNEFIFVVGAAICLSPKFGADGIWVSFPVGKVLMLLLIFGMAAFRVKRFPSKVEDYLFLPEDFDVSDEDKMEISATNQREVVTMAEAARKFCIARGVEKKKAIYTALCIEEMGNNIITYGFNDKKAHSIDIRLVIKGKDVLLRIRDNCVPFDPKKWMEIHRNDEGGLNMGIRMIMSLADSVEYVNTMSCNTLIIK